MWQSIERHRIDAAPPFFTGLISSYTNPSSPQLENISILFGKIGKMSKMGNCVDFSSCVGFSKKKLGEGLHGKLINRNIAMNCGDRRF